MTNAEAESVRLETVSLVENAPDHLQDLLGDLEIGGMNGEIKNDCDNMDDVKDNKIVLFSCKVILGIYDEEDLREAYRGVGVRRPEKWAAKMYNYVQIHR